MLTKPRDYYKVGIISPSGKGKTYAFRNMSPKTTAFINVENKPLPFLNQFVHYETPSKWGEVLNLMNKYSKEPGIDCVIIDSVSAFMDMVLLDCRRLYKNYDIWSKYNEYLAQFLDYMKRIKKDAFITGHWEVLNVEGAAQRRIKVKGKEWEGLVEKEFTMIIYAGSKAVTDADMPPNYFFKLIPADVDSLKVPPGMLKLLGGKSTIPNDAKVILDAIREFTGEYTGVKTS